MEGALKMLGAPQNHGFNSNVVSWDVSKFGPPYLQICSNGMHIKLVETLLVDLPWLRQTLSIGSIWGLLSGACLANAC